MTKGVSIVLSFILGVTLGATLPAVRAQAPGGERAAWYFYRVKWGHQDEFLELFKKNHYPVLKEQMGERLVGFKAYVPQFHGDGRADWTFATELVFKSDEQFLAPSSEEAIARRLYPDFAKFREEEARRFEILDAHWDIPLREVPME
ncbi:MAG TPA: hypothetical protein VEK15_23410 [Vicinamibacteria bacterium]|nr:hypothetical protein [Vicinamibacteria bacterium]